MKRLGAVFQSKNMSLNNTPQSHKYLFTIILNESIRKVCHMKFNIINSIFMLGYILNSKAFNSNLIVTFCGAVLGLWCAYVAASLD